MKKYFTILIAAALASCTTQQPATSNPVSTTAPVTSNTAFFKEISEKPDFQQVKISSRVDVQTGSFIPTLDATIYIENGQKVWMNMVAVFLNVGRGIATPAGIKGYEKWNKTYIESDFTYLNNLLNVNFIDFSSLQNLLTGRTFVPINEKDFVLTKNAQGYTLTSPDNLKFGKPGKTTEYKVTLQYTSDLNLSKVLLTNAKSQEELEVNYTNWTKFENIHLPKNVKINIKGDKTSQILLENTKFEGSKMDTPYSVPNNYTKTEIK